MKMILIVLLLISAATAAYAGQTCRIIGDIMYCTQTYSPPSTTGTTTCRRIGNVIYCN